MANATRPSIIVASYVGLSAPYAWLNCTGPDLPGLFGGGAAGPGVSRSYWPHKKLHISPNRAESFANVTITRPLNWINIIKRNAL